MDRLLNLLSQSDEEDVLIRLVEAQWVDTALKLRIVVHPDFDTPAQEWIIECLDVARFELKQSVAQSLTLSDDHVLMWPFREDTAEAFFYGRPDNAAAAVGRLYEAHFAKVEGWIPFEQYFNRSMSLSILLSAGNGKLASGPVPLLEVYKEVLSAHQTTVDIRFAHRPKRWRGEKWVDVPKTPLKVLLMDETHVVAEGFRATLSTSQP